MPLERVPDGLKTGVFSSTPKDKKVGKRGKHVVFIPWDTTEGAEWITKTNNWNQARPDKFDIVNYSSGINDQPHLVAVSNDAAGVVYIRGHGNPGFPYIMANYKPPRHDDTMGLVLPITEACKRLIDNGLGTAFRGVIKFYSCHSGTKSSPAELAEARRKWGTEQKNFPQAIEIVRKQLAQMPQTPENVTKRKNLEVEIEKYSESLKKGEPQDKSLARQGADYMRKQGFKHCLFYGYLGPLGSTYELDTDVDRLVVHKKVELDGLMNRPSNLNKLSTCRPSVARIMC
jgi:hypothetical protein